VKIRPERVGHLLQKEIADILANELRDPRVSHWVSVTGVDVTNDLSHARVYVSVLAQGAERDQSLQALGHASGYIRRLLAPRLNLREVPDLHFKLDESIERGERVEELLRKLNSGETLPEEDEDA